MVKNVIGSPPPPRAFVERMESIAAETRRKRRSKMALKIMQGLAAGLHWQPGLLTHPEEMASDAVAMADALLLRLDKASRG